MNIEQFWTIIERVHAGAPNDMESKCALLAKELRQLQLDELKSFDEHFSDCFFRAYAWDVWGAAFVICDGCSDDGFMDFRSTLISLGRKAFETALADADSLAEFEINPDWAQYEGYQYVSSKVYEELGGQEPECDCPECRPAGSPKKKTHPKAPAGIPFIEWEMSSRFPKLTAKYEFKDSDWLDGTVRSDKRARDEEKAGRLAVLMLEAGIIPTCGLIPPPRIIARLLRDGHAPESTGRKHTWEPCELDEGHYWIAVERLQKVRPEELTSRPDLLGIKLSLDVGAAGANDFEEWLQTIRARGIA
jgi:hypothetical protein